MNIAARLSSCLLLATASWFAAPAQAETFNTCAGFIDTLPATISTQGVWCLKKDLSTSMTSGNAINIATNNVTIDCNGFKIGGLAAGDNSSAFGIGANIRQNATVRNCAIRGFSYGISLIGAGHLVEDNRLDNNLFIGIHIGGQNNRVRRNAVYDTGGQASYTNTFGIYAAADIIDNTVAGVFAVAKITEPHGIWGSGNGTEVRGNRVRDLAVAGTGFARGITADAQGMTLADNRVSAEVATAGYGIYGGWVSDTFCTGNTVVKFATAYSGCNHSAGNLPVP